MVYINSESQKMTILKSKTNKILDKFVLINQTDKNKIEIDLEQDSIEYSKNTISINLVNILSNLSVSGQYDYYFYSNGDMVESGILQYEDFNTEIQSYNLEHKNIIQYNG